MDSISDKVLFENVKFHHNHFLVTKIFAKKNSAATRSWFVLRNLDSFFVDDIVFFKIRRTEFPDVVSWPQAVTTLSRGF
jgi:hypothetical protein